MGSLCIKVSSFFGSAPVRESSAGSADPPQVPKNEILARVPCFVIFVRPDLPDAVRQRIHESSVELGRESGYSGAGTIVFLYDPIHYEATFIRNDHSDPG